MSQEQVKLSQQHNGTTVPLGSRMFWASGFPNWGNSRVRACGRPYASTCWWAQPFPFARRARQKVLKNHSALFPNMN